MITNSKRAFGTRAQARAQSSSWERRAGSWLPRSFDVVLGIVVAVGLAVAYPLFW